MGTYHGFVTILYLNLIRLKINFKFYLSKYSNYLDNLTSVLWPITNIQVLFINITKILKFDFIGYVKCWLIYIFHFAFELSIFSNMVKKLSFLISFEFYIISLFDMLSFCLKKIRREDLFFPPIKLIIILEEIHNFSFSKFTEK